MSRTTKWHRMIIRWDDENYKWLKEQSGNEGLISTIVRQAITNLRLKHQNLKQIETKEILINEDEEEVNYHGKKEANYHGIVIDGPVKGEFIKAQLPTVTIPVDYGQPPYGKSPYGFSQIEYKWSSKGWTSENESNSNLPPRSGD